MKKFLALVLALSCLLGLVGCNTGSPAAEPTATEKQEIQQATEAVENVPEAEEPAVIMPLPVTLDVTNLEDCTVAVSLEKGGVYVDETGAIIMEVTVFTYDLYDMVDVALLKEGDTIRCGQRDILVTSVERSETGLVMINGGLDAGGIELFAEDDTVYYERNYSDVKSYYELGKAFLPVSPDFAYNDESGFSEGQTLFRAEDFLDDEAGIDYYFSPNDTTIRIEDGYVVAMTRVYAP